MTGLKKNYSVFFISLTYPPYIGGAERQMSLLAEELIKNEVEVKVFTMGHSLRKGLPIIKESPIIGKRINFINKLLWFACLFFQLICTKKRNVVIYSFGYGFDKFVIYFINKTKNIPYVIKLPGTWDEYLLKKKVIRDFKNISKRLQYYIIFNANKIVVQDKISVKNLCEFCKIERSRIALIPNGVKIKRCKKIDVIKKILFVGRIIREKGIFELLEAFDCLVKEGYDLELTVVGDGPDLSEIIQRFSSKKIRYIKAVPDVDIYYTDADLFILPSYREGLPNVVLEAMSVGLPVIATPVGALPEIFRDGEEIFYIRIRDVESIKSKIREVYSDVERARQVGYQAYQKVRSEFSIENNCKKYMSLFEELCGLSSR